MKTKARTKNEEIKLDHFIFLVNQWFFSRMTVFIYLLILKSKFSYS